jgi:catechol 2,3-dioxygenase-like lactoylglutathione lyase family enzyme
MESVRSCIPIIPSADLVKSLRFWVEGLGFEVESEMREGERLVFCMLRRGSLCFMLNQRAGTAAKPEGFEGIRLYWAPSNLVETRERMRALGFVVSDIVERDYGQTEFFPTDDDGYSHCFGVARHA